ncbi:sodium:solute symporter family protein [Rhodothermus profundi]|uniref:Cation/acetate symporter n=1 Tax=Rhodothermus profundi TaxID=633813 RepID=A0A1M6P4V5_9BACT|nr:sodium:solute symporter family protein [Rhodothermus profundi]SHK02999.1 cation/acetate symporter [Rhodothermus profundi]
MSIIGWTFFWVAITFAVYIGIAIWSRVKDTAGFYVAGQGIPSIANGAAVAADWMSAASFISMAGLISFMGYDGAVYLMGWTGGYVLLAVLLAPFLRKFGKFTVPDFVGERYYSNAARVVAAIAALFVSFTYVAGQMRGVGVVFSRFLQVDIVWGVIIGMAIVSLYAVLGGMKGITWTQVAQYTVLIIAYLIPAFAIAYTLTGIPLPQLALGKVLPQLDQLQYELVGNLYSQPFKGSWDMLNVFCVTFALMTGTAGLPHVIVRFYTVRRVVDARWSAFWALFFIGLLYLTAPAVAMFARYYILNAFSELGPTGMLDLSWVQNWAQTGLIRTSEWSEGMTAAALLSTIDRDIIVLATPEIANLSAWVVGLVAAGGLAAALSTASGLLLVIGSAMAHDIYGQIINPSAPDHVKLTVARVMIFVGVVIAGLLGIFPPGFVAEVVAFAFGLACSSFFPIIVLGVFWKRCTKEGAIAGMLTGLIFTFTLIVLMRADRVLGLEEPILSTFLGINAQGVGTIGMILNFIVTILVSLRTPPPPKEVQTLVEQIRYPRVLRAEELESA